MAGVVAVVELPFENAVPGVAAGARRARQAEDVGALGDAPAGARLDGRGAHLLEPDHLENRREAGDLLLEQWPDGLGSHVAAGEARTARGDDRIDAWVGDPFLN